jgi:hypothetical protein
MLSKQDKLLMVLPRLVKKVIGKWCYIKEGERKIHTLWDRWTCANGKEWSRGTKEVLVIRLHMVGRMSLDLLNLETLKFLMHFREPGSSLYLIFISYILIYYFFLFSSFLFLSLYSLFFFLSLLFFYLLPLNSIIALHLPPPPCLDIFSSSGKEVIEIR